MQAGQLRSAPPSLTRNNLIATGRIREQAQQQWLQNTMLPDGLSQGLQVLFVKLTTRLLGVADNQVETNLTCPAVSAALFGRALRFCVAQQCRKSAA
jgi:hypothetical protein